MNRLIKYLGVPVRLSLILILWVTIGILSFIFSILLWPEDITSGRWWDFMYVKPIKWVREG